MEIYRFPTISNFRLTTEQRMGKPVFNGAWREWTDEAIFDWTLWLHLSGSSLGTNLRINIYSPASVSNTRILSVKKRSLQILIKLCRKSRIMKFTVVNRESWEQFSFFLVYENKKIMCWKHKKKQFYLEILNNSAFKTSRIPEKKTLLDLHLESLSANTITYK